MINSTLVSHLKVFALITAFLLCSLPSEGATWVKLKDNAHSKLSLDKQSIVSQATLKKAWVKIEYKTPQKNPDSVDKVYNLSKALWHFDCTQQTSATTQVFQYLNQELVYSASVDMKGAEFIEPMPDSDLEVAMHYVCKSNSAAPAAKPAASSAPPTKPPTESTTPAASPVQNNPPPTQESTAKPASTNTNDMPDRPAKTVATAPVAASKVNETRGAYDWDYHGQKGPDQWAKLNPQYATCASGVNQSPVVFNATIHAALKPIRTIHKFAAKDIESTHRGLRIHFKEGNMMVLDKSAFQLKHVDMHTPSEHQLNGQSYPLEIQFFHLDSKKNIAMTSVLFQTGEANSQLAKLLTQLPQKVGDIFKLKTRLIPSDLIPSSQRYYRYSGSLTTPPCSEGVRWVVMKSTLQASTEQIAAITAAIGGANNRPIQPLHGRSVLE
jgi:carbonic anhydrase